MIDSDTLKLLSPAAQAILAAGDADAYSALVVSGDGNAVALPLLRDARPASLLLQPPLKTDAASSLLSGLWLWHDFLDESHGISQSIHSATGSYWHAVMHRREGDFGNSKYWYARCKNHPAHARIAAAVEPILQQSRYATSARLHFRGGWSPEALVDLAEHAYRKPTDSVDRQLAIELQRIEWAGLFTETIREAMGN
jgi:hypothetical protein